MKSFNKFSSFIIAPLVVGMLFFSTPAQAFVEILNNTDISGSVIETGSFSQVDGNESLSFVDEGWSLTNDFIFSARKRLKYGWQWDTNLRVRKTDDQQVDTRQDVHLLQLTTKLYNKNYELTFGDFYTRFTNLTLNRSLEGFNFKAKWPAVGSKINFVAARQFRGLEGVRNTRYVWGLHWDQKIAKKWFQPIPFTEKNWIKKWDIGSSIVHTFDGAGSIDTDLGVPDINNVVIGFNTDMKLFKDLNLKVELAKTMASDKDRQVILGDLDGFDVLVRTDYKLKSKYGRSYFNLDYERTKPDFRSFSGSFVADREAYYTQIRHVFNREYSLRATLRTLRDNLDDDIATTTRTQNPRVSMDIRPVKDMPDLVIRPYYDYRHIRSSNALIDVDTHLTGVEVNKKIYKGINVMLAYDLRKRTDDVGATDETLNEYRLHVNHTFKFDHGWISPYFRMKLRNDRLDDIPSRDTFRDFQWGVRFELMKRLRMNFNYGYNISDRAIVDSDSIRRTWNVDAEYDILDNLMMVLSWRQFDQEFQRSVSDFEENVGSLRLQYKY